MQYIYKKILKCFSTMYITLGSITQWPSLESCHSKRCVSVVSSNFQWYIITLFSALLCRAIKCRWTSKMYVLFRWLMCEAPLSLILKTYQFHRKLVLSPAVGPAIFLTRLYLYRHAPSRIGHSFSCSALFLNISMHDMDHIGVNAWMQAHVHVQKVFGTRSFS